MMGIPVLADPVDPLVAISGWVHKNLGIYYPEHKLSLLEGRLVQLCSARRLATMSELYQALLLSPSSGIALELAHAVSTNHTRFFREVETFRFFIKSILPSTKGHFRVWSAAASTGEESYTLAMMVVQTLGLRTAEERCAILGTDISAEVIKVAEAGCYRQADGVPPEYQSYLVSHSRGVAVHPGVKRLCLFRRLNLLKKPWPFRQQFQVILSRNVLYYFDAKQQEELLCRYHEHTSPGGFLLTSVTESLRGLNTPWKMLEPGIYRKEAE
jgi:chemotaxis protein methyltransferase CheR